MPVLGYAEELERKVYETLEDLALRRDQGVLSDREFKIAIDAIWNSAGGLVDGLDGIMEEAKKTLDPGPVRRIAAKRGRTIVVERDGCKVSIRAGDMDLRHNTLEFFTEAAAVEAQNDALKRLERQGHTIL